MNKRKIFYFLFFCAVVVITVITTRVDTGVKPTMIESLEPKPLFDITLKPSVSENEAAAQEKEILNPVINTQNQNSAPKNNEAEKQEVTVFHSPAGEKYHLTKECRYIKKSKQILDVDLKEALQKGLTPCSGCAS